MRINQGSLIFPFYPIDLAFEMEIVLGRGLPSFKGSLVGLNKEESDIGGFHLCQGKRASLLNFLEESPESFAGHLPSGEISQPLRIADDPLHHGQPTPGMGNNEHQKSLTEEVKRTSESSWRLCLQRPEDRTFLFRRYLLNRNPSALQPVKRSLDGFPDFLVPGNLEQMLEDTGNPGMGIFDQ